MKKVTYKRTAMVRTPYYYLTRMSPVTNLCTVKFLYQERGGGKMSYQVFFNTAYTVRPDDWDIITRTVRDNDPDFAAKNQGLLELYDFAMAAVKERLSQDEVRQLLDQQATRHMAPFCAHTKTRAAQALIPQPEMTVAPTPEQPAQPEPAPNQSEPAADDQREFWVQGQAFTSESRAVRHAWEASRASGQQVDIYERRLVKIGEVNHTL